MEHTHQSQRRLRIWLCIASLILVASLFTMMGGAAMIRANRTHTLTPITQSDGQAMGYVDHVVVKSSDDSPFLRNVGIVIMLGGGGLSVVSFLAIPSIITAMVLQRRTRK